MADKPAPLAFTQVKDVALTGMAAGILVILADFANDGEATTDPLSMVDLTLASLSEWINWITYAARMLLVVLDMDSEERIERVTHAASLLVKELEPTVALAWLHKLNVIPANWTEADLKP